MGNENVYDKMDISLLVALDDLRKLVGEPLTITSSYRSPEYNESVGGVSGSYHVLGKATDISCLDGKLRLKIVREAIKLGLSVGVAKRFLHIDNRDNQIVFTY